MLTSVTQFLTPVINLYSFPIELKPRIAKIKIYETVKITKIIFSFSEDITFVIFTVYLIEKSLYFIGKHIRKKFLDIWASKIFHTFSETEAFRVWWSYRIPVFIWIKEEFGLPRVWICCGCSRSALCLSLSVSLSLWTYCGYIKSAVPLSVLKTALTEPYKAIPIYKTGVRNISLLVSGRQNGDTLCSSLFQRWPG